LAKALVYTELTFITEALNKMAQEKKMFNYWPYIYYITDNREMKKLRSITSTIYCLWVVTRNYASRGRGNFRQKF